VTGSGLSAAPATTVPIPNAVAAHREAMAAAITTRERGSLLGVRIDGREYRRRVAELSMPSAGHRQRNEGSNSSANVCIQSYGSDTN
jgi:hypothetical protein